MKKIKLSLLSFSLLLTLFSCGSDTAESKSIDISGNTHALMEGTLSVISSDLSYDCFSGNAIIRVFFSDPVIYPIAQLKIKTFNIPTGSFLEPMQAVEGNPNLWLLIVPISLIETVEMTLHSSDIQNYEGQIMSDDYTQTFSMSLAHFSCPNNDGLVVFEQNPVPLPPPNPIVLE